MGTIKLLSQFLLLDLILNYEMLIYNRWGEIIFETHDVTYGWDGTYALANYTCQDGVYLYKIIFKNPLVDERKVVCGSVTLLK